jgi:hypothetical protein
MRPLRVGAVLAAVVVLSPVLATCSFGVDPLTCRNTDGLVLAAQSVPSAGLLPCVDVRPAGWDFGPVDVRSGRTRFTLSSDRAGAQAVQVTFTRACDTAGSTEIASDEPGTRRFERIEVVTPGFAGVRYYTFEGGCVSYRFRFAEEGRVLVNEASLALTFVSRSTVAEELRRKSKGRDRL